MGYCVYDRRDGTRVTNTVYYTLHKDEVFRRYCVPRHNASHTFSRIGPFCSEYVTFIAHQLRVPNSEILNILYRIESIVRCMHPARNFHFAINTSYRMQFYRNPPVSHQSIWWETGKYSSRSALNSTAEPIERYLYMFVFHTNRRLCLSVNRPAFTLHSAELASL